VRDAAQISKSCQSIRGHLTRPIYAGNAIATVKSSDAKRPHRRGTAFAKAAVTGGRRASRPSWGGRCRSKKFAGAELTNGPSYRCGSSVPQTRPQSSEKFHEVIGFADKLGAAVGASRVPPMPLCAERLSGRATGKTRRSRTWRSAFRAIQHLAA
jgi:electron transfer flavoprotein alpha subunit